VEDYIPQFHEKWDDTVEAWDFLYQRQAIDPKTGVAWCASVARKLGVSSYIPKCD